MNLHCRALTYSAVLMTSVLMISCSDEDSPSVSQEDHFEADGWVIYDPLFDDVYHVWRGESSDTLRVNAGCLTEHLSIRFLDSDSNVVNPPEDTDHILGWSFGDSTVAGIHREGGEWEFHLEGRKPGETTLVLKVMHIDHADVRTPEIPVIVEDSLSPCPFEDEDEDEDHDHE